MISIVLNGANEQVEAGTTLAAFVETLGGDPRGIAIERNREIVPKSLHGQVILE
ncbi:MAG: sulfur carrier protein ThiS, partial [Pseudomonadota bacterium]